VRAKNPLCSEKSKSDRRNSRERRSEVRGMAVLLLSPHWWSTRRGSRASSRVSLTRLQTRPHPYRRPGSGASRKTEARRVLLTQRRLRGPPCLFFTSLNVSQTNFHRFFLLPKTNRVLRTEHEKKKCSYSRESKSNDIDETREKLLFYGSRSQTRRFAIFRSISANIFISVNLGEILGSRESATMANAMSTRYFCRIPRRCYYFHS